MVEYTCPECGGVTVCWCGMCHACDDLFYEEPEPLDEGEDD